MCPSKKVIIFFLIVLFNNVKEIEAFNKLRNECRRRKTILMNDKQEACVKDLSSMNVKESLVKVCKNHYEHENSGKIFYKDVDILKAKPSVCRYLVANPKAFLDRNNLLAAKNYGIDQDNIPSNTPLKDLASILPVIYVADIHSEYGTIGYMLNKVAPITMEQMYPAFKSFRNQSIFLGGTQNRGSTFTMIHRKVGFPENRSFKGLPGNSDFKIFFSPDIAMANELCLTGDAHPSEFKFFQWSTVWSPSQLDLEYGNKMWLTIQGPVDILFDQEAAADADAQGKGTPSLWEKIVVSLPANRLSP